MHTKNERKTVSTMRTTWRAHATVQLRTYDSRVSVSVIQAVHADANARRDASDSNQPLNPTSDQTTRPLLHHHQRRAPQSLMRVANTDVWYWQTTLPANWRGSYCLMPDEQATDFSGDVDMYALRNWEEKQRAMTASPPGSSVHASSYMGGPVQLF